MSRPIPGPDLMIRVNDSTDGWSLKCEGCGCNVFRQDRPHHYRCNSCGEGYTAAFQHCATCTGAGRRFCEQDNTCWAEA